MEVLETSENLRTRNREAYVVTLTARKAPAALRAPLTEPGRAGLNRKNAARALKDLWVFGVAPETCNLACTHCLYAASPQTRNPYLLSEKELAGLLDQVNAVGARPHFSFTGGEPTLHPRIFDLLETIDRLGYSFQLMTNGTRISRKNAARLSRLANLVKVQVSLESSDSRSNDAIMGPGLHRRVLRAVDLLRENGVAVTVAATPMAGNEESFSALENLAREKGVDVIYISLFDLGAARENALTPPRVEPRGDGGGTPGLMCDRGVAYSEGSFYPCPVLVKEPGAKLGDTLEQALSRESREQLSGLRTVHPACEVCRKGNT